MAAPVHHRSLGLGTARRLRRRDLLATAKRRISDPDAAGCRQRRRGNLLYVAHGADQTDGPTDIDEASRVAWIPLDAVMDKTAQGEIVGAASQVGLLHVLARRTKSS